MKRFLALMMGLTLLAPANAIADEPITAANLLGCWSYSQTIENAFDYSSVCFVDGGIVETATGGGTVAGGLSGVSDGGDYAIEGVQVRFQSIEGGYGWPWADADVTCTAALSDASHLALTACSDGGADRTFEREVVAEEAAD